MLKYLTAGMFLLLMLLSSAWASEIFYVHDERRLGVRPSADSSSRPLEVIDTGARMELLERSGNYALVRTESGTEGWVSATFISQDKPALVLLDELRQSHEQLQQRLVQLEEALMDSEDEKAEMAKGLQQARLVHKQLEQAIANYRQQLKEEEAHHLSWLLPPLLGIGLFLFGIFLGVRWDRHRISERMGGLEI